MCKGQSSYRTNNSVMLSEWGPRLIASCPTVQFPFAPLIFCFILELIKRLIDWLIF